MTDDPPVSGLPVSGLLGAGRTAVRPVELFFDLVYVLAITQITEYLLEHLTLRGAGETLLVLLAVWGVWIHTTWTTNYFDLGSRPLRLVLIGLMFASLIMSSALPEAFGNRGLTFAIAVVVIIVGGTACLLPFMERDQPLRAVFERVLVWWCAVSVLWIAGGLVHGDARAILWLVAVLMIFGAMLLRFPVPVLGRSRTTDYTITGEHMADRCHLFITLALGESILVTGSSFGHLPSSAASVTAFTVAFVGSVTMWWIYYDRAQEAGARVIATTSDPGRLGLTAYTFFHIPMVTGIIVAAAADELAIAHPSEPATVATTAVILGGPALYLLGNALFKWALWHHVPPVRFVALALLAALVPVAFVASRLVLLTGATLVLLVVALWDIRSERVGDALAPATP